MQIQHHRIVQYTGISIHVAPEISVIFNVVLKELLLPV